MSNSISDQIKISDLILTNKHGYIAINKPAGIPCQADHSGDKSIQSLAEIYAKTKLHLLNRLDRPASGIVLLSKKDKFTKHYLELQKSDKVIKNYLAICQKAEIEKKGTLIDFIQHDTKFRKARITEKQDDGSTKAVLDYEIIKELDNYHIISVHIQAGKFHQIRAQLANRGLFIKGDVKYGARRKNKDRSIYLHAYKYAFKDQTSGQMITVEAGLPDDPLWKLV